MQTRKDLTNCPAAEVFKGKFGQPSEALRPARASDSVDGFAPPCFVNGQYASGRGEPREGIEPALSGSIVDHRAPPFIPVIRIKTSLVPPKDYLKSVSPPRVV